MSYNGWQNWETWNVALWCDNDEGIYRDRLRQKPKTADECRDFVKEYFPNGTPDMKDDGDWDKVRAAVDWNEIAAHWAGDYEDEEN